MMAESVQDVRLFYEMAYQQASIHDPQKGQVRGLSNHKYNDLCKYLISKVKLGGDVGEYAQQKLNELHYLKNCAYNKADLELSKPRLLESFFDKEKFLKRQNVISYDTMLLNKVGELAQANMNIKIVQDRY